MAADTSLRSMGGSIRETIPIYKPLLPAYISGLLGDAKKRQWHLADSAENQTAALLAYWHAFEQFSAYNTKLTYGYDTLFNTVWAVVFSYLGEEVTAAEAARGLQRKMSAALTEWQTP